MTHQCLIRTSMSDAIMEYWWKSLTSTAIPPISAFDFVGQQNKLGGITFWEALIVPYLVMQDTTLFARFDKWIVCLRKHQFTYIVQNNVSEILIYIIVNQHFFHCR